MVKKEEGYNVSESGNWNVANDYSRLKIMKNLYLADSYSNIATFGHDDFLGELNSEIPIDTIKIMGFERLLECLLTIIDNSSFAVKKELDTLMELKKELIRIRKIIPVLYWIKQNQVRKTKELRINQKDYLKILERVKEIKSEINKPLNKNHLIFTDKDEFDPQKYKEQVFDKATTVG